MLRQMEAVARRPSRQARGQRRRPALEIRSRPADRVRINHHASVAKGRVLVARRRLDGLVVDAGVGHRDAQPLERGNRAPFEIEHRPRLAQPIGVREIGAARIGDRGNADAPLSFGRRGQSLEPDDAGFTETLGIGHDVGLRHRHEIRSAEEFSHLDLMLQGGLRNRTGLAGQDVLLFVAEFHGHQSILTPASCTALPHLEISPR